MRGSPCLDTLNLYRNVCGPSTECDATGKGLAHKRIVPAARSWDTNRRNSSAEVEYAQTKQAGFATHRPFIRLGSR